MTCTDQDELTMYGMFTGQVRGTEMTLDLEKNRKKQAMNLTLTINFKFDSFFCTQCCGLVDNCLPAVERFLSLIPVQTP